MPTLKEIGSPRRINGGADGLALDPVGVVDDVPNAKSGTQARYVRHLSPGLKSNYQRSSSD